MALRALLVFIVTTTLGFTAFADQVQLEAQYDRAIQILQNADSKQGRLDFEFLIDQLNSQDTVPKVKNVLLKAVFDQLHFASLDEKNIAFDLIDKLYAGRFPLAQHLLIYHEKQMWQQAPNFADDLVLESRLSRFELSEEDAHTLCDQSQQYSRSFGWVIAKYEKLQDVCSQHHTRLNIVPPTREQLRDMVWRAPNVNSYRRGAYAGKPRLYQFCRTNRDYPCMLLMMDEDKKWVMKSRRRFWHLPVLARSRRELPFNQFGGDTPAGIYTIDGVMPEANKQPIFGKYRRLIMQFIPKSSDEVSLKRLIPRSNHRATWWKETTIARDMGRDLFRVHGTLRRNEDSATPYYPFYPTMGCVATRETEFDGVDYHDQRIVLDTWMRTQGLPVRYANETRIKGLLYVIEINNEAKAVTLKDLDDLGLLRNR